VSAFLSVIQVSCMLKGRKWHKRDEARPFQGRSRGSRCLSVRSSQWIDQRSTTVVSCIIKELPQRRYVFDSYGEVRPHITCKLLVPPLHVGGSPFDHSEAKHNVKTFPIHPNSDKTLPESHRRMRAAPLMHASWTCICLNLPAATLPLLWVGCRSIR
jgi:hypothetical protein